MVLLLIINADTKVLPEGKLLAARSTMASDTYQIGPVLDLKRLDLVLLPRDLDPRLDFAQTHR